MIEVIKPHPNPEAQPEIVAAITRYHAEARQLMPEIPENLSVYFDQSIIMPGTASGGYAHSPNILTFGFDYAFPDEVEKWRQLRGSTYHEDFHLAQGFTGFDEDDNEITDSSAIDNAIYEGAATVFEREYGGTEYGYGQYLDEVTMKQWVKEVKALPKGYDWKKWKFYDPDTDRKWIMYRAGTFIVDQALAKSGHDILDLRSMAPAQIFSLAEL